MPVFKQELQMIYDRKPWLKSYDPGVEPEIQIPDKSLTECFIDTCRQFTDRAALHYMGMNMTFGELLEQSGRFARGLIDKGLGKGDVVTVHLPNIPQYLVAMVGTLRAGCVLSGLSPLLISDEIIYQLNDCRARALVTLDALFETKFAPVADRVPDVKLVLVTGALDMLSGVRATAFPKPLPGKEVMPFLDFVGQHPDALPEVPCAQGDICYLQYTGGTTGPSKGAMLTHGNMVANIHQYDYWMQHERGNEVLLTGFPMFHQAGLFVASSALARAYTQILIPDPRNLDHIVLEVQRHRPTLVHNVPSLYLMLLAHEEFRKQDFSRVKCCMSGAAPFPADKIKFLEEVMGTGKMVEVWGMTETSPLITVNPSRGRKKTGSVGLPLPNTCLRVVDLADGKSEVRLGEEGELVCSGPQVMKGYLNKPDETRNALREHAGARWMHTGDVGRMDEDGYVYVVDRAKDMIIVGGYKVFSSEVEDRFYKHPAIGMCALIGVPNPERPESEVVKLVVQKSALHRDAPDGEVEAELRAFAREKLAPYKTPKVYEFVDAIPLTSVGKVNKKALRPGTIRS